MLQIAETDVSDLDLVLIGGMMELFADEIRPFTGWFDHWERPGIGGIIKRACRQAVPVPHSLPFMEPVYYMMLAPSFRHRRRGVERIVRDEFSIMRRRHAP